MLKLTPVAASLIMALGGVAYAAAPAANSLPGAFLTNDSTPSYAINGLTGAVSLAGGNAGTVLQFGGASSSTVNNTVTVGITTSANGTASTVAGFNIGASAALNISASSATNVLVSDLTGQASNIYGNVSAGSGVNSLFIANPNGVVVGGFRTITAPNVALVGYQADAANFTAAGTVTVGVVGVVGVVGAVPPSQTSPGSAGTSTTTASGDVTVNNGATVNAGYLLMAGAVKVNVGFYNGKATAAVAAGSGVTANSAAVTLDSTVVSSSAVANLGGNTGSLAVAKLGAAGAVNVLGSVGLSNATIGGTLTNNANLTLGGTTNVATFANNANASVGGTGVTFGGITNNANLIASAGPLTFGGAFVNAGKATVGMLTANSTTASVSNAGTMSGAGAGIVTATTNTLASFTNTGTLYDGGVGIQVTAGSINLGGTVANASGNTSIGSVVLQAQTGDLTGTANLNSLGAASLTALKGNISYTGNVNATSFTVSAATGAVALGAVNVGTPGTANLVTVNAGNGNITLGGNITANQASFTALGGSVLANNDITATSATINADSQILVNGNINAGTAGTVSLSTNKVWTGPYNLGVVIQPSGGVTASTATVNVASKAGNAGNMLQYGNISATTGFQFTGNSYYQGAGAAINSPAASFVYGNSTSGGVIAGGIVNDPANPQPSNAFFNAVMVGGSNATGGVSLAVTSANLGAANQNVNLMWVGDTPLTANLGSATALFGSAGFTVINDKFVPSNLFICAQGGNLTLSGNSTGNSTKPNVDFYWPGPVYASTVQKGMNATVDTTKTIALGGSLSNALPYQATGGAGMYLMTGKVSGVSDITVNTNSNINVLSPLQLAGVNLYTSSAPTGLVLNYNATLASANVVSFTPSAI